MKYFILASAIASAFLSACGGNRESSVSAPTVNAWMSSSLLAEQTAATSDAAKETVGNKRAKQFIAAMTLEQKMQQLTGAVPGVNPELPSFKGGSHVDSISALDIPTFRITNGPVGVGQNDCVSISAPLIMVPISGVLVDAGVYTDNSSANATARPSAISAAAAFDSSVAASFGNVIGTEMANFALHEFEAPGSVFTQVTT